MIKRLAKLKQFGGKKDLNEFMTGEFRQNMLAIEAAFKDVGDNLGLLVADVGSLSIANNVTSDLVLTAVKDDQRLLQSNVYTADASGTFICSCNLFNLLSNGIKTILLNTYVNSSLTNIQILYETTATTITRLSPNVRFKLDLTEGDKVTFSISNASASNSNVCTIDGGLLNIHRLQI